MVPCYEAMIFDEQIPATGSFRGYGAHLDPHVAMVRALTEAVQSRCVYIAGSRDDLMSLEHRHLRRSGVARLPSAAPTSLLTRPTPPSSAEGTFEEDCATLLKCLAAAGIEHAVVIDLTPEEFEVAVVRVVVPGLEGYSHFQHYAPGPRGRAAAALAAADGAKRTTGAPK
jgi:ribosomal protein S12 methylthiotransferase accessory factor